MVPTVLPPKCCFAFVILLGIIISRLFFIFLLIRSIDGLNIVNSYNEFDQCFMEIYPQELQLYKQNSTSEIRGRFRTAASSKMGHFVIIVNGFRPLTIITKSSILDVAAVLDPPLTWFLFMTWTLLLGKINRTTEAG